MNFLLVFIQQFIFLAYDQSFFLFNRSDPLLIFQSRVSSPCLAQKYTAKFYFNYYNPLHQYIIIFKSKMMQVIHDPLLLSPPLKPISTLSSNSSPSDTRSNASVDSQRSRDQNHDNTNKVYKNENTKAKSSLCRNFMEKGSCPYGNKCQFAHGLNQLRCNSERQMLYKTRPCNAFLKNGVCMYGTRCNFLHKNQESPQSNGWSILGQYREIVSRGNLVNKSILLELIGKKNLSQQNKTLY